MLSQKVLCPFKNWVICQAWWHMPVIPVAREADARGSQVLGQPQQKQGTKQLSETPSVHKIQNGAGDVAQWSSAPEFNPHSVASLKYASVFSCYRSNLGTQYLTFFIGI